MTDLEALTLTIWGEARGEPIEGKIGVAMVMRNRVTTSYRGSKTYLEVCTAKEQFSAWTQESQQMLAEVKVIELAQHPDPVLQLCIEIAKATIVDELADNTRGSNHYYAISIPAPPWAVGKPFTQLGAQRFLWTE